MYTAMVGAYMVSCSGSKGGGGQSEGDGVVKITTADLSGITAAGAVTGGAIASDGGVSVTARGVCWGLASSPVYSAGNSTSDGSGTGTFVSTISGLRPATTYYVRAYATNGTGTYYGNELTFTTLSDSGNPLPTAYNIYLGNTHSHSNYSGDAANGGTPAAIFAAAKGAGYDFDAITDHTQYAIYNTAAWTSTLAAAYDATTPTFVAIRSFEFSGSSPKGHINIFNTPDWLVAVAGNAANTEKSPVSFQGMQTWLGQSENGGAVACFNHPGLTDFNTFALYNPAVQGQFTMIELINVVSRGYDSQAPSNWYYDSFKSALQKGWKVSPVAGCDNHNLTAVAGWGARTGIAATALTRDALYDGMRNRRTFATFDKTLKVFYTVNDQPMGSILVAPQGDLHFSVKCSNASANITKIDVVGVNDRIAATKTFAAKSVDWQVDVPQGDAYYYLVIYEGGAAASPISDATAWVAPVWIQ